MVLKSEREIESERVMRVEKIDIGRNIMLWEMKKGWCIIDKNKDNK